MSAPLQPAPQPDSPAAAAPRPAASGTLVLMRHGERADAVPTHPWYAAREPRKRDPPLTPRGVQHVRCTAQRLRRDGIASRLCTAGAAAAGHLTDEADATERVVLCSPLARCLMSGAALAASMDAHLVVVYALAKSTTYFRRVRAGRYGPGVLAEVADPAEAQRIVSDTNPSCAKVRIVAYVRDDGRTCRGALDRAVRAAAAEGRAVVVAGHCEAQRELAHAADAGHIETPYCGVATFAADGLDNGPTRWRLTESPLQHRARWMRWEHESDLQMEREEEAYLEAERKAEAELERKRERERESWRRAWLGEDDGDDKA